MGSRVANAAVRVRRQDTSFFKVTHEITLVDEFPGFPLFTFDTSIYIRKNDDDNADMNHYEYLEGSWDNCFLPSGCHSALAISPRMATAPYGDEDHFFIGRSANTACVKVLKFQGPLKKWFETRNNLCGPQKIEYDYIGSSINYDQL